MSKKPKRVELKILRLNQGLLPEKTHFAFRGNNNTLVINDLDSNAKFYLHSWMQMTVKNLKKSLQYNLIFSSTEIKHDEQLIVF